MVRVRVFMVRISGGRLGRPYENPVSSLWNPVKIPVLGEFTDNSKARPSGGGQICPTGTYTARRPTSPAEGGARVPSGGGGRPYRRPGRTLNQLRPDQGLPAMLPGVRPKIRLNSLMKWDTLL